ncbi:uncharacterized protein LOC125235023 [Leguminivora glycinivorella]|uniref:uncharacterized protein LOC125235023 n=1 Tax=Leguminivora glycinivorella TaxID=1035111 RepID=UPI00200E16AF|nr:uncharacterized protein LOC125235023 [Leguminivora glycinivorella]
MIIPVTQNPEELPEWVSIYFMKKDDNAQRCNICETVVNASEKSLDLLDHLKTKHAEVIELHKNPDSSVGFRIEFLQLNVLDDGTEKTQPVILGEVCEGPTEEVVSEKTIALTDYEPTNVQDPETQLGVEVLRQAEHHHLPLQHLQRRAIYQGLQHQQYEPPRPHTPPEHLPSRSGGKGEGDSILDLQEVETPYAVKTEEITDKDYDDGSVVESPDKKAHRSWVWSYFKKLSGTQAQCKLCNRNISHGGNATGNMNRHIKMIHKEVYTKVADENSWVWKVFESDEDEFYSCKICQFKCTKYANIDKSVLCILKHLKADHGVVSGDQIITSVDCDT